MEEKNPESFTAFEKLLESVGSDGQFQRNLVYRFMLPMSFFYGFAATNLVLLLSTPNHNCFVPGREQFNLTLEQWQNLTIPRETGPDGRERLSQCKMYNITINGSSYEEDLPVIDSQTTVDCEYGWIYDDTVWKATAVTNYDWVCKSSGIVADLFTLKMIGAAIATFAFSILSDRYGRRPNFFASLFFCAFFGPAMAFAPNTTVFAVLEFGLALAFYTVYQMPFLIVMELCSEKLRSFTVISSFLSCIVAICLVPLLAWLIAEWKLLLFVYHLPMAAFFLYWRYIPESPRWLLSQDKLEEFNKVMRHVAAVNGKEFTPEISSLILLAKEEEKKKVSVLKLFKSYVLVKHLVITSILLSLGYMFYSGVTLNLLNMTGNTFVNFFLLSVLEFPGNIVGSIASDFLGRRISSVLFELLSAISIYITVFYVTNKWAVPILCATSKMFVGGMILAVYKQVGELFPTALRATAYGITGIVGLAASVVVPQLMAYGSTNVYIPYYILTAFSFLGAIIATFLPETIGLNLPQTMKEATSIGKNQPYFTLIYKGNAKKLLSPVQSSIDSELQRNLLLNHVQQPIKNGHERKASYPVQETSAEKGHIELIEKSCKI